MNQTNRRNNAARCGFTLIEAMIAMLIIGLTIAALVASTGAFSRTNAAGIDLSTAEFLIEEIRELTASLPVVDPQTGAATFGPEAGETSLAQCDDLDDFNGASYSPPIDINRAVLASFPNFTQQIQVRNVAVNNFSTVVANHSTNFYRVTVTILMNGSAINSATWIRAR
jgi:prepilin-type N-terminal cleavage/methylation domain-containing protein